MLQLIKSESCGISATFFQCCFMIETQVVMTVSNFLRFCSRNHFLEGGFTFQWGWGGLVSQMGASFLGEGGGGAPHGGHQF